MAEIAPHDLTTNTSHSPYVASSSTFFASLPAFKAFDGSDTTYWLGTNGGVDWLQMDLGFGYAATLDSYQIQVNSVPEPNRAPKDFTMQGSTDGSSFTTLDTQTSQTGWTSGERRTYTLGATSAAYRFFRLNITANNGDATYTQTAELYLLGTVTATLDVGFAPHDMTSGASHSPFVATASSNNGFDPAYQAFDGIEYPVEGGQRWIGVGSGVDWLKLDCGDRYILSSYAIAVYNADPTSAPQDWTMEGSNDDSSWSTLDTVTAQTGWTYPTDARVFTCDVATSAYRYFRLNITDNNGGATDTQVGELYLYGTLSNGAPNVIGANIPGQNFAY